MAIRGKVIRHELEPILDFQFKQINRYISEMTVGLSRLKDDFNKYIDEEIKNEPLNEQSVIQHFSDDIRTYNDDYYNLFIRSTFVSIYSLFEFYSYKLCVLAAEKTLNALTFNSSQEKNTISKHKNYLEQAIRLNLKDEKVYWKKIDKEYKVVRNLIVHQNSNIIKDTSKSLNKQDGYSIVSNKANFNLDEDTGDFQIHNTGYLFDLSSTSKHYLTGVLDKVLTLK